MSITIADLLSFIDSKKRTVGASLRDIASDPMEFLKTAAALQMGPSKEALADPNALLASPGGTVSVGGIPGVMTYHGTPHNVARYDLSKVGTGQGAQTYGHGIYFAENPAVANVYKDALSRTEIVDAKGNVLYKPTAPGPQDYSTAESRAANALQYAHDAQSSHPFGLAREVLRRTDDPETSANALSVLSNWQEIGAMPKKAGALYQQDLPDEVLPQMLQWDKSFAEQPQSVRDALAKAPFRIEGNPRGDEILGTASTHAGGPTGWVSDVDEAAAADLLRSLGIPGLSYLDAGSRHLAGWQIGQTGKGTWLVKNNEMAPSLWQEFPTQDAATAALVKMDPLSGGTRNHVVWDQELLDRMFPEAVR